MTNERNTEALSKLIADWMDTDEGDWPLYRESLAKFLAERGVLAVDSLTDEQARELIGYWPERVKEAGDDLRAALRRCATGEPTPAVEP